MRKNKKASIISLEVLIGVIISIIILVSAVTIIRNFYRLSDASKDSFNQLVALIEEVNGDNHGTRKSMPLRMDKGTAIIGFPKNHKNLKSTGADFLLPYKKGTYIAIQKEFFNQLTNYFNEKDKSIICLCREFEKEPPKCKDGSLVCKTFDELEFHDFFIFSRETGVFFTKDDASQFKVAYVEKYGEYGEDSVAVCGESEEDSCISKEYKEEKKAIHGLNNFKNFIELCKDREFVEDEEPCSCGAFNFRSFIPKGYSIEFSKFINPESDEESLNLTLMKGKDELGSIDVETKFCRYNTQTGKIDYPKSTITLEYDLEFDAEYLFYYISHDDLLEAKKGFKLLTPYNQIAFVKYDEENICLAYLYNKNLNEGYIEPYKEPFDTINIIASSETEPYITVPGCGYGSEETNEFW